MLDVIRTNTIPPGAVISQGNLYLKVQDGHMIANTFPAGVANKMPMQGCDVVKLPYAVETLTVLRNLGYDIKGMDELSTTYPLPKVRGMYEFMPHQIVTAGYLAMNPRAFCTSTMRVGKTASAIAAIDYVQRRMGVGAALVIAPMSTLWSVWEDEVRGLYPNKKVVVLHAHSAAKRRELLSVPADIYVINPDGIKVLLDELIHAIDVGKIDIIVIDELTNFANARTDRWSVADQLVNGNRWDVTPAKEITLPTGAVVKKKKSRKRAPSGRPVTYCWGLTGTPGGPEKVYAQIKLVTPQNMNMSFQTWQSKTMVKANTWSFTWIPKHGYKDIIFNAMQPCIRYNKYDIMDIPVGIPRGYDSLLTSEQEKLYRTIKSDMQAAAREGTVSAATKSTLSFKMFQITTGSVITDSKDILNLDIKNHLDSLEELINGTEYKVVIFASFRGVIDRLCDELNARGIVTDKVHGGVTDVKRANVFRRFQDLDSGVKAIVCHPVTTAFGIELAAANTMIFYGPPVSGDFNYQQAVERMSSIHQQATELDIIHFSSIQEERKLFSNIQKGVSINESITSMFDEVIRA